MLGIFFFYFMLSAEFRLIISPSGELHCNTDLEISKHSEKIW